jgi:hypothetical protein
MKDSDPPVCGVHNVMLAHRQLPEGSITPGYKAFTYLACPVSDEVVNEAATH